ncbi:hypothetical protein ACFQY0_08840 [Haloferula chungangensis]|uniref:Phage tail tape measure protein n=1 Tax=Haloferula chungangensis TaxID=1048331 RepID=A0ABW2L4J6_9BACT
MAEVIKTVLTADSSDMRTEFEKASSVVKSYTTKLEESRKRNARAALDELRALKLEANGQQQAAQAIRESIRLKEQALRLAKQTGLSEQAAMVMLRKKAELLKQLARQEVVLANQRQARAAFQATQGSTSAIVRTGDAVQGAGKKAGNAGLAFLELSRAVEDAQYGFRGVMNNLPGMVMMMGGTAGLAGAVSVSAVAVYNLNEALAKLHERGSAIRDARNGASPFVTVGGGAQEPQLEEAAAKMKDFLEVSRAAQETRQARFTLDQRIAALRLDGSSAAEKELQISQRELAVDQERARILEGRMAAEEKTMERLQELEDERVAAQARALELTKQFRSEREKAGVETSDSMFAGMLKHFADSEFRPDKVAQLEDARTAADLARVRMRLLDEELSNLYRSTDEKRRALKLETAALEVLREREALAAKLASKDEKARAAAEEIREAEEARQKAKEESERRMARDQRRGDFAGEMRVSELEHQGRTEEANALREELRLRRDAVRLAKDLEISEDKALEMLRRKLRLEHEGNAARNEGGSKIRQYAGSVGLRSGATLNSGGAYLRSELQRRGRERSQRPRDAAPGKEEDYLAKMTDLQERQLAVWERLQAR